MKILITGGLGFIGSNLVNYLIKKKPIKKIIIIDNQSKSDLTYLESICKYRYFKNIKDYKANNSRVTVVNACTTNSNFSHQITKNLDCVVHLAAESGVDLNIKNPKKAFDINIKGTFNFLDACRVNKVNNFIFASSGAVFGNAKPPMSETTIKTPISTYGSSKLAIETFCETYSKLFDIKTTVLRFSNAYGPYSLHKKSIIANFLKNIIDNKPLIINGDGKTTRDYVHASDISAAIYKSFYQKENYNNFNISTSIETSINDLVSIISSQTKKYDMHNIKVEHALERLGDMKYNSMNSKKYISKYKKNNFINLNTGIQKTIKWFISNYK
tara:strand:+ start:6965 stop:7948 length:984 start_codon:yes stop_codon:yes gene_type:complete